MSAEVSSIADRNEPVSLLSDAMAKCRERKVVAAHVMLMDDEDGLWSDACGATQQELAWALLRMIVRVVQDD